MKLEQTGGVEPHPHLKRVKTGGRVLGTPNRLTNQIRLKLGEVLLSELSNLPNLLEGASPDCRIGMVLKLANLLVPTTHDWDRLANYPDWDKYLTIEEQTTNNDENPNPND